GGNLGVKFRINAVGPPGIQRVRANTNETQLIKDAREFRAIHQRLESDGMQEKDAEARFCALAEIVDIGGLAADIFAPPGSPHRTPCCRRRFKLRRRPSFIRRLKPAATSTLATSERLLL